MNGQFCKVLHKEDENGGLIMKQIIVPKGNNYRITHLLYRKENFLYHYQHRYTMPFDTENYMSFLEDFPNQCKKALELARGLIIKGKISNIIVCGMGGSAIGGDILRAYLTDSGIPVIVCRDYTLPSYTNEQSLVFAISYSGNTEEVLSANKEAVEKKAVIWTITSGGKLSEICRNVIKLPVGFQPRAAVGYLFFPMACLLFNSRIIDLTNSELNEMLSILRNVEEYKDKGNQLAMRIKNKVPVIYSSSIFEPAAYRMKCEFNENSKHPAFHHVFPEMNHNEIVGYRNMDRNRFVAIFIRDEHDHERIKKRMDILKEIIEEKVDVVEIKTLGRHFLSRMFSAIYYGDFASYYLAAYNRVEPAPVEIIERLKLSLADK